MSAIHKDEVAQYYIQCELGNIIVGDDIQIKDDLYHSSQARLLEALSLTYRMNGVFDHVQNNQFYWELREVSVDDIVLTGMGKELTEIIYSDYVQQNPRKFAAYIQAHLDDEDMAQLRPRQVPDNRKTIILREHDGVLKMLDGSHRLLSLIMAGATNVTAYVAVPMDTEEKPMIGDAIFYRLKKLWESTDDLAFKHSIEQTVLGMMKATDNGRSSVERYWVSSVAKEEIEAVVRRLVDEYDA